MIKEFLCFFSLYLTLGISAPHFAQSGDHTKLIQRLAAETGDNYIEGFSKSLGSSDFNYHSFRDDLTEAMLTRCTDGQMAIEWQTAPVSGNFKGKGIGFVWITAIDLTKENHSFDVLINGQKKFQLISGDQENIELQSNDGGKLKFITAEIDRHGDAHGYMTLWAPAKWISPGKPVTVKIVGSADKSNTWVIVYKAADALDYLHKSMKYNSWANISINSKGNHSELNLTMPLVYADRKVILSVNKQDYQPQLKVDKEDCRASIKITSEVSPSSSIILKDEYGEVLNVNSLADSGRTTSLTNKAIIQNSVSKNINQINISSSRIYKPNTVNSLLALANSNLSDGTIYLMNSSHQDIAWMDSPEKCIIDRDTLLLTPLFTKAEINPDYRFDVEDVLMLKEYIHRHKDKKEAIKELLKNGRISCGSSYNQPYEELYSGETLARQFYLGKRWLKKEFDYSADTYWNVDVPGRVLQMPQILKKSGTDYMVISRIEKGIFNWQSPDGSYVTTYSPGHYGNDFIPLQKSFYSAAEYVSSSALDYSKYFQAKSRSSATPLFSDQDMSPAKNYSSLISQWNNISRLQKEDGSYQAVTLPKIRLSLTPDFIKVFTKNAVNISAISGERPAVWLYIHGPTHEKAISASREADILLPAAEKFAIANALPEKSFANYPQEELNNAWEAKIYPDHGWGGKHGEITDALFQEKYYYAKNAAENILSSVQKQIAAKINTNFSKGIPLVVFNSLSWTRTDNISSQIKLDNSFAGQIDLKDASGNIIPSQIKDAEYYTDGSLKSCTIHFIAKNIPGIGYKTFYINPADTKTKKVIAANENIIENNFYKVELTDGGITSIFDKQLNKELLNTKKFKGAEIFTMHSEGTGAGEFADIQQPDMQGFDKSSNYKSNWTLLSDGNVFTEYFNRQPIRNAVIEQNIKLYKDIKKIAIDVSVLNYEGVLYREYRMAMPLNMNDGQVSYETAYGVATVGKDEIQGAAGERYKSLCKSVHPRGICNWIGASNKEFGVTLSPSTAVADYIDPTSDPTDYTILQPLLFASRRSCHEEGNEYLQPGDHHFSFTLTSHVSGWKNGFYKGVEANEKLRAVFNPRKNANAPLGEELSFFSCDNPNIIISALKKAEDEDAIIIRVYNISGNDESVKISGHKYFTDAERVNLIEEPIGKLQVVNGSISQKIGKYAIETFKIKY